MAREPDYLVWQDEFDDQFLDDEDDDCIYDCGLMPNGQCMLAGTEFCDWDCGGLG